MITVQRMIDLISGTIQAETLEEQTLVEYYVNALAGHLLMELVSSDEKKIEKMSAEALRMIMYGYSVGQKHYDERIQQFELEELTPPDSGKVH